MVAAFIIHCNVPSRDKNKFNTDLAYIFYILIYWTIKNLSQKLRLVFERKI